METLCGIAEAAEILGWSKQTLMRVRREPSKSAPHFPAPNQELQCGPIWTDRQIREYGRSRRVTEREKFERCREAGIDVELAPGWDMKALWQIHRMLSDSERDRLLRDNGWEAYYEGVCRHALGRSRIAGA